MLTLHNLLQLEKQYNDVILIFHEIDKLLLTLKNYILFAKYKIDYLTILTNDAIINYFQNFINNQATLPHISDYHFDLLDAFYYQENIDKIINDIELHNDCIKNIEIYINLFEELFKEFDGIKLYIDENLQTITSIMQWLQECNLESIALKTFKQPYNIVSSDLVIEEIQCAIDNFAEAYQAIRAISKDLHRNILQFMHNSFTQSKLLSKNFTQANYMLNEFRLQKILLQSYIVNLVHKDKLVTSASADILHLLSIELAQNEFMQHKVSYWYLLLSLYNCEDTNTKLMLVEIFQKITNEISDVGTALDTTLAHATSGLLNFECQETYDPAIHIAMLPHNNACLFQFKTFTGICTLNEQATLIYMSGASNDNDRLTTTSQEQQYFQQHHNIMLL